MDVETIPGGHAWMSKQSQGVMHGLKKLLGVMHRCPNNPRGSCMDVQTIPGGHALMSKQSQGVMH